MRFSDCFASPVKKRQYTRGLANVWYKNNTRLNLELCSSMMCFGEGVLAIRLRSITCSLRLESEHVIRITQYVEFNNGGRDENEKSVPRGDGRRDVNKKSVHRDDGRKDDN